MVNSYEIIIIGLVIVGCCIAAYSDIKCGKISNNVVLLYGIIPVLCNCINIYYKNTWMEYLINCSVAILIAIFLYALHIWAGGDCKLVIFIALSIPTSFYWPSEFAISNLAAIYLFIFSYGFIYICFDDIKMIYQKKSDVTPNDVLKEFRSSLYKYMIASVYIILIRYIVIIVIGTKLDIPLVLQNGICILAIFAISRFKALYQRMVILIVLLIDVCCVLYNGMMIVINMIPVCAIVILLILLRIISNIFNYEIVETSSIEKGMILSRDISILMQYSRVKGLPGISDETLKSRLSEDEADAVIRWGKSKNGLEIIKVVRRVPFAIFITIGMISYLAVRCIYF